jgi:hypothetical protein
VTAHRDVPQPHQVATFDQAYAECNKRIDDFIAGYLNVRAENAASRDIDIAGLGGWLLETEATREVFAELLTVAIVRLAEQGQPGEPPCPTT